MVINVRILCESFCYEVSFVAINCAIRMILYAKNPPTINNILRRFHGYQFPCLVTHKNIKFTLHGLSLMSMFKGLFIGGGNGRQISNIHEIKRCFGFENIIFGLSSHEIGEKYRLCGCGYVSYTRVDGLSQERQVVRLGWRVEMCI